MKDDLQKEIKSGEFTFCSRCGNNCRIGNKDFMCTSCKASLFSKSKMSKEEVEEKYLKQEAEAAISAIVKDYRLNLAILRNKRHA